MRAAAVYRAAAPTAARVTTVASVGRVLHRDGVDVVRAPIERRQWLWATLLACALAALFLRDALLPGRALVPHPPELFDVVMAEAHAAGRFDAADAFRGNVGMADKYLQSLCWDRVMMDRFRAGELPRWTNDIAGGAPFVPQMAQPWQPINALLLLLPSEQWYGWWCFVHLGLFGLFAYAFLRRLGCLHGAALLALVAAELGLWTQCKVHHNVIWTAALSLWPMLAAAHALCADGVRGGARRRAVGWLGVAAGLSWSTGFVPVALQATYLTVGAALLFAVGAPRGDRWRRLAPVGLGLLLGALAATANMAPILQAAGESARAGTWSADELRGLGLDWDHALGLLWPDLLAWAGDRFYVPAGGGAPFDFVTRMPWSQFVLLAQPLRPSDQSAFHGYVETACSVGVVPLAAALAAFGDRARRGLALACAAAALASFGFAAADEPFFTLARAIPGYAAGDLRRQLFTTAMMLVVLAGLGADRLLRGAQPHATAMLLAGVIAASTAALGWLALARDDAAFARQVAELIVADGDHPQVRAIGGDAVVATAWLQRDAKPGEAAHNRQRLQTTAARAIAAAMLGLVGLLLAARARAALWLAATAAELLHAGLGPVQTVPAERLTTTPRVLLPAADAAPANGDRPRLARLTASAARKDTALPGNLPGFLRLEDSGAYNPLPKARYEQFVAAVDPSAPYGGAGVGSFHDAAALTHPLCDLFGVRFVLTREAVPVDAGLVDRTPPGCGVYKLFERTTALPRATFVQQVDVLPDATARLAALGARDRDVRNRIALEDAAAPTVDAATPANARVELVSRRDERVVVRVRADAAGYLRLADPWDAGWRATVDGAPAPIFVADHHLRAVHVTAGEHEVVFTYDGWQVVWPLRVTLLAYALALWLLWPPRRRA